jgi:RHS repeat-associated protein
MAIAENSTGLDDPVTNKYLYQGKEYQNELGLDTYDFEWRMYDPAIGRTFQLDPDAANYYRWSPNMPFWP